MGASIRRWPDVYPQPGAANKYFIDSVTMEVSIKGQTYTNAQTFGTDKSSWKKLFAGDVVRGDGNTGPQANGERKDYTVLFDESVLDNVDLSGTGAFRAGGEDARTRVKVKFHEPDKPQVEQYSEWVNLDSFLDKNVLVCHIGDRYSDDGGDWQALNPLANKVSQFASKKAVPYVHQYSPTPHHWYTGDRVTDWREYTAQTVAGEYAPDRWTVENTLEDVHAYDYRCRNPWFLSGDISLATNIRTNQNPFLDDNERCSEMMVGEEMACVLVWSWGKKNVADLSGGQCKMVDVRLKTSRSEAVLVMFPGAVVKYQVDGVNDGQGTTFGGLATSGLRLAAGLTAVAAGPEGWIALALSWGNVIVGASGAIHEVYGGVSAQFNGSDGAEASAYTLMTINDVDGSVLNPHASPSGAGSANVIGLPDDPHSRRTTDTTLGDISVGGSATFGSYTAAANQAWIPRIVMNSTAYGEEGWLLSSQARSAVSFTEGVGVNAGHVTIASSALSGTAEGETLGE